MGRGRDAAGVPERLRAEAQRCLHLAEAATTPHAARLLRQLASEYEARAAALEAGIPVPRSRFMID